MRYFKHLTLSHIDEKLSQVTDLFGAEGYGVYWIILEKIASQMDYSDKTFSRYFSRIWINSCRISEKKFKAIINFFQELELIFYKYDGKYLTLDCPNLLKYRDEYSSKKIRRIGKVRTMSGHTPDVERTNDQEESDIARTYPKELELKTEGEEVTKEAGYTNTVTSLPISFDPVSVDENFFSEFLSAGFAPFKVWQLTTTDMVRKWKADKIEIQDLREMLAFKKSEIEEGVIGSPNYFDALVRKYFRFRTLGEPDPRQRLTPEDRAKAERAAQRERFLKFEKEKIHEAK
ncbi:MAG TPA: Lin1244/Lin1753 domain-containing protein [Gammaproteobacteria bacterium]|jgi:hypothetical protein|nr:Lin1244/Lin1753 domain-containing protein [Gammaproteobacteria bacterium]